MQIGTLDDWIERKLGPKRATPAKRMERQADGRFKPRDFGPALASRPRVESVDRIDLPAIPEAFEFLYGKRIRLQIQTSE